MQSGVAGDPCASHSVPQRDKSLSEKHVQIIGSVSRSHAQLLHQELKPPAGKGHEDDAFAGRMSAASRARPRYVRVGAACPAGGVRSEPVADQAGEERGVCPCLLPPESSLSPSSAPRRAWQRVSDCGLPFSDICWVSAADMSAGARFCLGGRGALNYTTGQQPSVIDEHPSAAKCAKGVSSTMG